MLRRRSYNKHDALPPLLLILAFTATPLSCPAQSVLDEVADRVARRAVSQASRSAVLVEWDQSDRRTLLGVTGTVLDESGRVLTAGLPAKAARGRVLVTDQLNRRRPARWIGFDAHSGLTLLALDDASLPAPRLALRPPQVGERVFVLRHAASGREVTEAGTLRKLAEIAEFDGQLVAGLLEFAAPLTLGDAGAMLTNAHGELIGIVRGRLPREPSRRPRDAEKDTIGVAVPIAVAVRVADRLASSGQRPRGYLGIVVEESSDDGRHEVRVVHISPDTPAHRAGLLAGDVIYRMQRRPISDMRDLIDAMESFAPGDRVSLDVARDQRMERIVLVLGAHPEASEDLRAVGTLPVPAQPPGPRLGLVAQDLDPQLRRRLKLHPQAGALIVQVTRNSPADRAGIRPLDVIVAIDGEPIQSSEELQRAVGRAASGQTQSLQWFRGQQAHRGEITLGASAVDGPAPVEPDRETSPAAQRRIEQLQRQIEQLQQRIRELEAQQQEPRQTGN